MVSTFTMLAIQNRDVFVSPYQDQASEKWGYSITLGQEDRFRPLATYSPVYPNRLTAEDKGHEMVAEIRSFDLSPEIARIDQILGEAKGLVGKIADASRKTKEDS